MKALRKNVAIFMFMAVFFAFACDSADIPEEKSAQANTGS